MSKTDAELTAVLHGTTDAAVWAREFVALFPPVDEGLMISWFANAIEIGRTAGEQSPDYRGPFLTPNLGLATTRELLAEISTRIEVDGASGGGGLDYTTVGGRPAREQP
jgi:hypothetical protein